MTASRCKRCDNERKREQERRLANAARGLDGKLVEPVRDEDPWPAVMLRECMKADRDVYGLRFDDAWSESVEFVLRRLVGRKAPEGNRDLRSEWADAFTATRVAWEAAWYGEAGPGRTLTPALLDGPSLRPEPEERELTVAA
jgi:hypothetical protein